MRLRILSVPDCPNVAPLQQRLAEVLAGREDVTVTSEVIDTPDQAARVGMTGSPTLLVDGIDPFAQPEHVPSVSCRIYRDETGASAGMPSVTQLRAALGLLGTAEGLRTWRARTTPTDPAARAVHQTILQAFATTGGPPTDTALERAAATHGVTAGPILARLHEADVIRLDPAGAVRVAYPFSAVLTLHRVRLATGVEMFAMCAIDALGIPAMLDTDATITSTDPVTHQSVTASVHNGRYTWSPATAVVFSSAAAGTGPSADCCCNDLNTFTGPATARTWMSEHPAIPGELLDTATAERLGQHIFGGLLL